MSRIECLIKCIFFGINGINDRLIKSIVESNLNILYNDIKNKIRIYIEESVYVNGIID